MAARWQIGDCIKNRWEVYKILYGGMGIVYMVYDHELHEVFATKTFQDEVFAHNPTIADRFMKEALAWVNLDAHENVTRARFVWNINGRPFLFLEYVSGGDLASWIGKRSLTHDLAQVLLFGIQFCDGMIHALSKGIKAHHDIKPQNCLITNDRTLKLTDFGLAKVFDDTEVSKDIPAGYPLKLIMELSRTGKGVGTPLYMAPEQFDDAKHVDVRADIYSFGVMLFQMVTGQLPFIGINNQYIEQLHKIQSPPSLDAYYPPLTSVVQTCLAKDPANRFTSFSEIREQLVNLFERLTGKHSPQPKSGEELDAVAWNNKGLSLFNLEKSKEALVCYNYALKLDPYLDAVWLNKGMLLGKLGQSDEAFVCFDRALELNQQSVSAWNNKAQFLNNVGRHEEALICCDRALKLNQNLADAWNNKGVALRSLERHEEALNCYDCAIVLDPILEESWHNKGNALFALARYEEAIACYDRALEINPLIEQTWIMKAHVLSKVSQHEEALNCCDRGLELNQSLKQGWFNKGVALQALGRLEESLTCYDRYMEFDLCNKEAWLYKGVALAALGCSHEALACFEEAQRLGHTKATEAIAKILMEDVKERFNKGIDFGDSRQCEEAIACFDCVIQLYPAYADAWFSKGVVLVALGRILNLPHLK